MKKQISFNKIYIGLVLFLITLCFYCISDLNFFTNFCLFGIFVIMIGSVKEVLNATKLTKSKFLQIILFIFVFLFFCYFLSFLLNFFHNKNDGSVFSSEEQPIIKLLQKIFAQEYFLFCFLFFLICLWICFLFIHKFRTENLNFFLLILLYIVFSSACFFTLVCLDYKWFLYLFIITISSDSFAFLGGILFGKNLLYPSVSPKKTWEGFFCGVIVSFIIILCCFGFKTIPFWFFTFFSCIMSQFGDLISSKLKRDFSIKDFGSIIPGHGGLLDRFDSLLFLSFCVIGLLSYPYIYNNISLK
ncbi:phosphatidate cytidylyltransferase [Candidatus Phytoplasma ziziphi]|uniref:Phosphatidate cytidylyltransferase n=1 Tax=Ziziphus jujuba witches'-broom phytoplasma TaxID=135727 RepID=A0A660HMI1_ZIZJU|nr:phosphatidate cytidylyltransferase [Candidatus Phytoplasma ziziphi]AYJ00996.1 phosphatidate cytidylyltransferase [Candidatus Phytoplasma ziziphi]